MKLTAYDLGEGLFGNETDSVCPWKGEFIMNLIMHTLGDGNWY